MNEYSALIIHAPTATVVFDEQMELTSASREAFTLFGIPYHPRSLESCLQKLYESIMNNQDLVNLIGASTLKLRRPGSADTVRWQKEDLTFDIDVYAFPSKSEIHYGVNFRNISERLQLEKTRAATRNYLERILDDLDLGIIVMDKNLRVTSMNTVQQSFLKLAGQDHSLVEVVGIQASRIFGQQHQPSWDEIRARVIDGGEIIRGIVENHPTQSGERIFSVNITPLKNDNGDVTGAIRVCEDITRQRQLEEEAHNAEILGARLETLKHITVTLNHEINTCLTTIITQLEILKTIGSPLPEDKQPVVEDMTGQAERIKGFIQKLSSMKEIKTVEYLNNSSEQMIDVQ